MHTGQAIHELWLRAPQPSSDTQTHIELFEAFHSAALDEVELGGAGQLLPFMQNIFICLQNENKRKSQVLARKSSEGQSKRSDVSDQDCSLQSGDFSSDVQQASRRREEM